MTMNYEAESGAETTISAPSSSAGIDQLLNVDNEDWYLSWLDWLCDQLPNLKAALVISGDKPGDFQSRAIWPRDDRRHDQLLLDAAATTLNKKTPLITPLDDALHQIGSYPVFVEQEPRAVVTVLLVAKDETDLQNTLGVIEYCCGWLELKLARTKLSEFNQQNTRQQVVIETIAKILGERDFDHAALRFVNLMATHLQAERVAFGFVKHKELSIHSQSDSSDHGKKYELVKLTTKALQEAVDQQETVNWPARDGCNSVSIAHRKLSEISGQRALLSIPLVDRELCFGAILLDRPMDRPFSTEEQITAEALANYVGVVLEEKRQASLPLYTYIARSFKNQLSRLVGPGHMGRKITLFVLLSVSIFLATMPGSYYLGAEAVLEGAELRSIVVPFDSYLQNADYRAGDKVKKGTVLAELDTRELRLQRISWISQQATSRRQYEDALAKQQRAQVQISKAQMERAAAELQLIDYQTAQSSLVSPFDALLVSGDLSQRVGASVRQGDVLFEVSPSTEYRLALYVDEFRINDIRESQSGKLVVSALPDKEFAFTVTRINPLAEVRDGATVYRVEAKPVGDLSMLSVGLEGVAKVYIDRRLLFSIWTRGARDWLTIQLWRFWG
jgi:hypothetical protein